MEIWNHQIVELYRDDFSQGVSTGENKYKNKTHEFMSNSWECINLNLLDMQLFEFLKSYKIFQVKKQKVATRM